MCFPLNVQSSNWAAPFPNALTISRTYIHHEEGLSAALHGWNEEWRISGKWCKSKDEECRCDNVLMWSFVEGIWVTCCISFMGWLGSLLPRSFISEAFRKWESPRSNCIDHGFCYEFPHAAEKLPLLPKQKLVVVLLPPKEFLGSTPPLPYSCIKSPAVQWSLFKAEEGAAGIEDNVGIETLAWSQNQSWFTETEGRISTTFSICHSISSPLIWSGYHCSIWASARSKVRIRPFLSCWRFLSHAWPQVRDWVCWRW